MLHQLTTPAMPESHSGSKTPWVAFPQLGRREFDLFRQLLAEQCGLKMPDSKRLLLQNRIGRRLRALGLSSFEEYFRYVQTAEGKQSELTNLWSAVTTNETHFFREPHHFEGLRDHILPTVVQSSSVSRVLRIWSAGCSTGQEPYTLAMVLDRWLSQKRIDWRFRVVGSDIDTEVIEQAQEGRYPQELKKEIPSQYLLKYFEIRNDELIVRRSLRARVSFINHNFADVAPLRPRFDVIFCRNAMMYLHNEARARLLEVFFDSLNKNGWLVLGTSESLQGIPHRFTSRKLGERMTAYQALPASRMKGS